MGLALATDLATDLDWELAKETELVKDLGSATVMAMVMGSESVSGWAMVMGSGLVKAKDWAKDWATAMG